MGGNCNQDIFGMINNIMGQSGMGSFFNGQFGNQNGFDQTTMNNIFNQFNIPGSYTNYMGREREEQEVMNNMGSEEEETEEELQIKYIQLRNSIINQLPRFKYSYYKNFNKNKEIQEYKI
jgi:hypothetical protein